MASRSYPCTWARNGAVLQARLPNPHGDLAKLVPTTSIKQANKHVEDVMSKGKQRQEYQKVSIELKTKVAKYEAETASKPQLRSFKIRFLMLLRSGRTRYVTGKMLIYANLKGKERQETWKMLCCL